MNIKKEGLGLENVSEPLICVNFKAHPAAFGTGAESLAAVMDEMSRRFDVRLIAAVSAFDLGPIISASNKLEVWSQHLDPIGTGSHTGQLLPSNAVQRGAVGTLLNHAEKQLSIQTIAATLELLPKQMTSCVCAADVEQAREIARLGPDLIAVEPPELIGGDISVTTADPQIIIDTVAAVKAVNPAVDVLTGAGVKSGDDIIAAIEFGTRGVLLASGVTKASDVESVMEQMCSALSRCK